MRRKKVIDAIKYYLLIHQSIFGIVIEVAAQTTVYQFIADYRSKTITHMK